MKNRKLLIVILISLILVLIIINFIFLIKKPIRATCFLMKELDCEKDSDCIYSGAQIFVGNKNYYETCIDKVGTFISITPLWEPPVACIDRKCTINYPDKNWTLDDCGNKLKSQNTRTFCRDKVILETIQNEGDISLCDKVIDENIRTLCYNKYYSRLGVERTNQSFCEKITFDHEKGQCFTKIASKTGNTSLCEFYDKNDHERESCYIKVAIGTGNIDICRLVEPVIESKWDYTLRDCYNNYRKEVSSSD